MKTAHVRTVGGVPRLEIDGKPLRARLFWGGANSLPVPVGESRTITFTFRAPLTTETATLHFRFGQELGTVQVSHVRIEDATSKATVLGEEQRWNVWPPTEKGRVSFTGNGFQAQVIAPPKGTAWPDFHVFHDATLRLVKNRLYRVTLTARAEPMRGLTIALYQPGTTYTPLAGPSEQFEHQIKLAAQAGVNLVSFEAALPWPAPGEAPDFRAAEAACERVLSANPKALLLPRIGVYPPPHWLQAHPDAIQRWDDGPHEATIASATSAAYRRDGAERLTALIRHLESRFGEQLVGYHPTGQNTGEWFWMDSWTGALPGYAPCDKLAWDAWRAAQKLAPAAVPAPAERRAPVPSPDVVAFHQFLSESMAETALTMARAVRQATGGKKLSLLFYGYGFEFAPMPSGPANSGHYALRKLLASPDVDILCGPYSYYDRQSGGSGPVMSAADSVLAAGKLWLNEDDTRTYLAKERTLPGWDSGADDLAHTLGILTRNLAQNACRNHATWWMDLPGTGWFDDPQFWALMRSFAQIDSWFLTHPTPFHPEVALVLDESAIYPLLKPSPTLSLQRGELGRMGAPYSQYLVDDVLAGHCPAKLVVAVLTKTMTPQRRAALVRACHEKILLLVDEKPFPTARLRQEARQARVHLYTDSEAAVFANGPFFALHATKTGTLHLTLRHFGPIYDALTGALVGSGPKLTLDLKKGETRILR